MVRNPKNRAKRSATSITPTADPQITALDRSYLGRLENIIQI